MVAPLRKGIWIVDDDESAAEELADFLRWHLAAEPRIAHSVATARELLATDPPPELCLVDIRMPRESGMTLVELLRRDDRAGGCPEIILMSGFHDAATLELIERQKLPFLPKPILPERLVKLLEPLVGRLSD